MKTTIEITDPVYRQVKARAALRGQTMKAFVSEAICEKLTFENRAETTGWRATFGEAPAGSTEAVQATIDEEFSKIDLEAWR